MVPAEPTLEAQVAMLADTLHSPHLTGVVLRVLIDRLHNPRRPYTDKELQVLLVLTLALVRAGMWP